MFNNVMVPLDASPLSEIALDYAQGFVTEGGKLTLLTVLTNINDSMLQFQPAVGNVAPSKSADEVQDELRNRGEIYLRDVVSRLRTPRPDVELEAQIGNPANTIIEIAQTSKIDAIVMSTHGRTGLSRWILGSVTQKVLNAAPCPVIVIPGKLVAELQKA